MPARNPIPLEGVLNCWTDPYDLPDLILAISRSGKTGRLSFSNPEGDKTVYVKDGKIVFAESSSDDDGLGQYLLRNGQISLDDFTRVSKLVSPGKRLGALLVAEGVLEPKDLVPAVVGQVRAVVLGLFRRTESWYGFKEEELSRRESITLEMPVAQLILEGVQLVDSWRRISKGVGDLNSVYRVAGATEVEWSRMKLESGPTELLEMLSEPMRINDVCDQSAIDDFDACRYLWAFKSLEWIEPAEISVDDAAELADRAEMAQAVQVTAPLPVAPAAPVPVPPPRAPDLATTVMNLEPAAPIAPALLKTKVSAVKVPEAPRPPQPATPRAGAPDLHRTQLAVDLPATPPTKPAATRRESVPESKPLPPALHHTQLYLDEAADSPEPAEPTTGEMMEAILDGSGDAPSATYKRDKPGIPARPEASEPRTDSATQFFPAAAALEPKASPKPPEVPEPPEEDFFRGAPGFASLTLDYQASSPPELPPALPEPPSEPSFSSFSELAPPPPPEEEMPLIEATVVEEAQPVPPALVTTEPSVPASPAGPSGLEFFAMNDPFRAPDAVAPPPSPFATDDPLQYAETSVAASLPRRPRTDDLDLEHLFDKKDK
jgi:hypothetical protein